MCVCPGKFGKIQFKKIFAKRLKWLWHQKEIKKEPKCCRKKKNENRKKDTQRIEEVVEKPGKCEKIIVEDFF